jgi:hypothetical protein
VQQNHRNPGKDEKIMEKEYVTTSEECQRWIRGVCPGCGGIITPIETVDNAKNPTFWSGCMHCHKFCSGVDPMVYTIARIIVDENWHKPYNPEFPPNEFVSFRNPIEEISRIVNRAIDLYKYISSLGVPSETKYSNEFIALHASEQEIQRSEI